MTTVQISPRRRPVFIPRGFVVIPYGDKNETIFAPIPATAPGRNLLAERMEIIKACDYRTDSLNECSCKGRKHCGLSRGQFPAEPWAVTLADCLRCVDAGQTT